MIRNVVWSWRLIIVNQFVIFMNLRSQIQSNKNKTYLLVFFFILLISFVAYVFGEVEGFGLSFVGFALIFSGLTSLISYYYSDKMVLALSGAKEAKRKEHFNFYTVTENLCLAAGIPKPRLYVIEDTALNAFATGRDPHHAVIVATTGILDVLDRGELEGVIAHELSHIRNYDIRLMSLVAILVGTIALLADMFLRSLWWRGRDNDRKQSNGIFLIIGIVLAILAPLIATLIKLAVSRRREYLADASGADLTRNPEGLARALAKIGGDREVLEAANSATAHLYIANPFKGKEFASFFANLFNTHPPIEDRIKRLQGV